MKRTVKRIAKLVGYLFPASNHPIVYILACTAPCLCGFSILLAYEWCFRTPWICTLAVKSFQCAGFYAAGLVGFKTAMLWLDEHRGHFALERLGICFLALLANLVPIAIYILIEAQR